MSQITGGIPFVVDGPRPVPPPYSLLETIPVFGPQALVDEPVDPHWQNGVQVWSYPPDLPQVWDGCGTHGTFIKADGESIPTPQFSAYSIYLPITCSTRGLDPGDITGWQNRAIAAVEATESFALEREISQGTIFPLNPHFTDSNAHILNGGNVTSEKAALGFLADAVGATGRQGLIHATPGSVVGFTELDLYRDRDYIYSADGIPMVRGAGYVGARPSGQAAAVDGQAWVFATGPMYVIRGAIQGIPASPSQALDRGNNIYTFYAERNFVVYWDTELQAAVLVDWTA